MNLVLVSSLTFSKANLPQQKTGNFKKGGTVALPRGTELNLGGPEGASGRVGRLCYAKARSGGNDLFWIINSTLGRSSRKTLATFTANEMGWTYPRESGILLRIWRWCANDSKKKSYRNGEKTSVSTENQNKSFNKKY